MTWKALMIVGIASGLFQILLSAIAEPKFGAGPIVVLAFTSGALFGKGYGVWEERGRR